MNEVVAYGLLPVALVGASAAGDLERMQTFLKSLDFAWTGTSKFHLAIVTRDADFEAVCSVVGVFKVLKVVVYKESIFIGRSFGKHCTGWWRQQLVKIYAGAALFEDYFITFDADIVAVNKFDERTFIGESGKVCPALEPVSCQRWWENCASNFFPEFNRANGLSVTPNILNGGALVSIINFIGGGVASIELLKNMVEEKSRGSGTEPWTEYSVITILMEKMGIFEHYYSTREKSLVHSGCNVWHNDGRKLADILGERDLGVFSIIQSTSGISQEERDAIVNELALR